MTYAFRSIDLQLHLVTGPEDACNLMGYLDKAQRQRKLDCLREHCQTLGRPYEQIEKTLVYFLQITHDGRNGSLSLQLLSIVSGTWQVRASTR